MKSFHLWIQLLANEFVVLFDFAAAEPSRGSSHVLLVGSLHPGGSGLWISLMGGAKGRLESLQMQQYNNHPYAT